jgi:hypothetical protein
MDARHKAGHDDGDVGQWPTWQMKAEENPSFTID